MSKTTRAILIAAIVAFVGGISVAAVAQSGDDRKAFEEPIAAADSGLASQFAVLSTPRDATDALPANLAEHYAEASPVGVNGSLARLAISTRERSVYVVPGADAICTVLVRNADQTADTTCATADMLKAATNGPGGVSSPEGVELFGVVPDGVDGVDVTLASGKVLTQPVQNNAYLIEVPAADTPLTLKFDGREGVVSHDVRVPDVGALQEAGAPGAAG